MHSVVEWLSRSLALETVGLYHRCLGVALVFKDAVVASLRAAVMRRLGAGLRRTRSGVSPKRSLDLFLRTAAALYRIEGWPKAERLSEAPAWIPEISF